MRHAVRTKSFGNLITLLLLIASFSLMACNRIADYEQDNESVEIYEKYITELDTMLINNEQKITTCEEYLEFISSIHVFHEDYHGYLQADYNEDGVLYAHMLIAIGEEGEAPDDKQKWIGQVLEDGSLWLSYQSTYDEKYDLPDYIVSEDALRYERADYVSDNRNVDAEQQKEDNRQQIEQALSMDVYGSIKEFWKRGESVFLIERDSQRIIDVTDEFGGLIVNFWEIQLERIGCQTKKRASALSEVESLIPEGYKLIHNWYYFAVSDLNEDRRNDYVVLLQPDDECSDNDEATFWLILSKGESKYEHIMLSDTIAFRTDYFQLTEVTFTREEVLRLEYFDGYDDALLEFKFNDEEKNFYISSSYYRRNEGRNPDQLLIGNKEDYGNFSMGYYMRYPRPFDKIIWESASDIILSEKATLEEFSASFLYENDDLLKEHLINSRIWDKEYEMVQTLLKRYDRYKITFNMLTKSTFYSDSIISGYIEIYGKVVYGNCEREMERFSYPVMIDKTSGEYVRVTECIDKKSFLQIFRNYVSEDRKRNEIDADEIKRFERAIEMYWDNSDILYNAVRRPTEVLYLQISSEGVVIGVRQDGDSVLDYFVIDRECFLGTELWKYLKPERNFG